MGEEGRGGGELGPRGREEKAAGAEPCGQGPRDRALWPPPPPPRPALTPVSDINIKDAIALESTQRPLSYRHQSIADSLLQEPPAFSARKSTLLRDWVMSRTSDVSYERKLRSLMEKGVEPKAEAVRMLKPEEVLSCR